jgi:hypothetical protein
MAFENSWQTVRLDGGWRLIMCKFYILQHNRMETSVFKMTDGINSNVALLNYLNLLDPKRVNKDFDLERVGFRLT